MKSLLITIVLVIAAMLPGSSQKISWQDNPGRTYVFEINNDEALQLVNSTLKDSMVLKMLHTPLGSFAGEWNNQPAQGHFIFADIDKNKVRYRYAPVIPFQVFLFKEYGKLTIQVTDTAGRIVNNAKVLVNRTQIKFDEKTKTYSLKDRSEKVRRILSVELNGFKIFFDLNKHLVMPWYGRNNNGNGPDFYSYLITDKNKYKPGETIRFKSYALTGDKSPIKRELELWMSTDGTSYSNRFKKIKQVAPYHPGGFAGEFRLVDSLKLKLDRYYTVQLRDREGKIAASAQFKYEDYELFDNHLEVKLQTQSHFSPDSNKVEIKACDANGLLLKDVKAEVLIRRRNVLNSYAEVLLLPDTLLYRKINLDNDKPTDCYIPADIFGQSDCVYDIQVLVTTYENQRMTWNGTASFYHSHYNIVQTTSNDSICFSFYELGKPRNAIAVLSYDNDKKTKTIQLPYAEKFNQAVSNYHIILADSSLSKTVSADEIWSRLKLIGGINEGTFNVQLENPLQLDVSWYIYKGGILLQKGSGKAFEFERQRVSPNTSYYVEVFYFMGDEEQLLKRVYSVRADDLSVDINLPERIYPGQNLDATVSVKDYRGKPVPDVDLTAFSVNSLLNYNIWNLPYYGARPSTRAQQADYDMKEKMYFFEMQLDYKYWNKMAHLDQQPYYQFTYPWNTTFIYKVNTPDTTTQFAPYAMKDGNAIDIYVIEKNDKPVYFSWTNQPKGYSFLADSGKQKITLRLWDRAIVFDSLQFEQGKKTIFSIDIDHLPAGAKVINMSNSYSFGSYEADRYKRYISRFPVRHSSEYVYLLQGNAIYNIYHPCLTNNTPGSVLAGPIPEGRSIFRNADRSNDTLKYKHEGGFSYRYDENVVYKYAENVLPASLQFTSNNKFNKLNDFYLSQAMYYKTISEWLKNRYRWLPRYIYLSQKNMTMQFNLPEEKDSSGVSNLLFQHCETGKIIFPDRLEGNSRMYSAIAPARYNVILLYNNGKYLKCDTILLRAYSYLDVNMNNLKIHEADSLSQKWLKLKGGSSERKDAIGTRRPDVIESYTVRSRRGYGNTVEGSVFDTNGESLPGASIIIQGTSYGVLTDMEGHFAIEIDKPNTTLQVSYVGYKTKTIVVSSKTKITITMEEDLNLLNDMVVVAYGRVSRSMMTGSSVSVSANELRNGEAPPQEKTEDNESKKEEEIKQAEEKLYNELLTINGLRTNFSDVGFWKPDLYTDKKGQAQFNITFPDNITQWNTVVYAMNKKLQTGTARRYIKSYKPLMAELKTPQFLTLGDSSYFAGNIRNYTKDSLINGRIEFSIGQNKMMQNEIQFTSSYQNKLFVPANSLDSITTTYLFTRADGYNDGEQRNIAVIPQGTEIAEGGLSILRNGDTVQAKANDGETIVVTVTGKQLDVYINATAYLTGYAYACNEQLASKLVGLLNYKLYARYKGEKFTYDKQVNEIITRLHDNQNAKKLWSWWGNSTQTSFWMSAHIMRALKMAKDAGYTVNTSFQQVENDYADIYPYRQMSLNDLSIINSLSQWGAKQNYKKALDSLEKMIRNNEAYEDTLAKRHKYYSSRSYLNEKLLIWEIRQQQGIGYASDSISKYLKKDILGQVFCDDGLQERYWYSDKLQNTLIAYRIIKRDSSLRQYKEAMQLYILSTKRYGWNTYQASSAVMDVLPDLLADSVTAKNPATMILSGKENKTITQFPYETKLLPGEILNISKKEGMPLLYSSYSVKRVTQERTSDAFEITSSMSSETLKAGQPVTLTVNLKVKQENEEHVMIEVPIPASCSYNSKSKYYGYYYYGNEVHREYFKERTVIFCEKLPKGEYKFQIDLLPRFTGNYVLNPAKVELMYFPVINANNDIRKVEVVEGE